MESTKLHDWLQVAGLFGVILSLVFVGIEMRQARQIAIADIYQQRTALAIQVQNNRFSPEQYRAVLDKLVSGDTLTGLERNLFNFSLNPWFSYWENNHFQYQLGLLSEEQWQASRNAMRGFASRAPFRKWWAERRGEWRESFALEVDAVIKEELSKQKS